MRTFSELNEMLLLGIEDENGAIKSLQLWKEEAERVINTQVDLIYDELDIAMLEDSMDKIICTRTFFESFEREANEVTVRYTPYRAKADEVMSFKWPSDEEYVEWSNTYLKDK